MLVLWVLCTSLPIGWPKSFFKKSDCFVLSLALETDLAKTGLGSIASAVVDDLYISVKESMWILWPGLYRTCPTTCGVTYSPVVDQDSGLLWTQCGLWSHYKRLIHRSRDYTLWVGEGLGNLGTGNLVRNQPALKKLDILVHRHSHNLHANDMLYWYGTSGTSGTKLAEGCDKSLNSLGVPFFMCTAVG